MDALEHPPGPLEALVDARAEMIRRDRAADGDPVVGGPLGVDEQVAPVGDHLAPGPADLVPDGLGQRRGSDHVVVDRDEVALVAGQFDRIGLGRKDDRLCRHPPRRCLDDSGPHVEHGGLLADAHADSLHRVGETARQTRGLDARVARAEDGAEASFYPDALDRLAALQPDPVRFAEPE